MTQVALIDAPSVAVQSIPSALFGPLSVPAERVFTFDRGILGFPSYQEWVVIDGSRTGTAWLQSVDHEAITFLLVDPFAAFETFSIDLAPADLARIGATHASDVLVFALVTLPRDRFNDATANLQGPLVLNIRTRRGMQFVLEDGRWDVRERLPLSSLGAS
jgi:flagellar assembly factor FliW